MTSREKLFNNLTKFFTLDLLNQEPMHGYKIMKQLENLIGKEPSPGQIYPLLTELKEKSLIEVTEKGDRKKKIYKLTNKGENKHKRLVNRFNDIVSTILEPKLTECAHCGCKVYEGGYQTKVNDKKLVFCCKHCARHYKKGR
ncbi:hypothetical protein C9439_03465 [archaeon SCG-AAA382B04]|nr:hypothetical protein C9439_03465 [archaeon SCG-AAA382B04]